MYTQLPLMSAFCDLVNAAEGCVPQQRTASDHNEAQRLDKASTVSFGAFTCGGPTQRGQTARFLLPLVNSRWYDYLPKVRSQVLKAEASQKSWCSSGLLMTPKILQLHRVKMPEAGIVSMHCLKWMGPGKEDARETLKPQYFATVVDNRERFLLCSSRGHVTF